MTGTLSGLKKTSKRQKMKSSIAAILALMCVVGLALADYGYTSYMPYYGSAQGAGASGFGNGGFLMLIGFLFIILLLFGTNNQDTITFVNVTTK